ncbi:hypothetical protein P389DRAFT_203619 [Cystobasidium minutum MCA 4210]|uniref:uncharacterized protein n=1 Tax=Cystobasidium minutum MCA 4210 TaxID=1397322 RepID=UPI0034CDB728|eukprot:jgi/Rhomi1/203619/MIX4448_33_99
MQFKILLTALIGCSASINAAVIPQETGLSVHHAATPTGAVSPQIEQFDEGVAMEAKAKVKKSKPKKVRDPDTTTTVTTTITSTGTSTFPTTTSSFTTTYVTTYTSVIGSGSAGRVYKGSMLGARGAAALAISWALL